MKLGKRAYRGIRKTAHLSHKVFSKASQVTEKIENKADRILHGRDANIVIDRTISLEEYLSNSLPEIKPIQPALPLAARKPNVTLLIPSLQSSSFFGGTATALMVAAKVCQQNNLPLRIVETLVAGRAKSSDLSNFFSNNKVNISQSNISIVDLSGRKHNHYGYLDIHPEDIYVASAWWDAYQLINLPLSKKFIYIIQDFEPIFYNNSDKYLLAENTYSASGFVALCNTKLMNDFMDNKGYLKQVEKTWFEPAVSYQSLIDKRPTSKLKRKIFLYGRPNVERNLFNLGLQTLQNCFMNHLVPDEWDVYVAGQDGIADISLPSGVVVKNLGKMNMKQYTDFIPTVDIAISLMMAPHPNYPTLEFASAGAVVVTTKYDIKKDLSTYSKNIIAVNATAEKLSEAIVQAANKSTAETIKNANDSNIKDSWDDALNGPVKEVLRLIN